MSSVMKTIAPISVLALAVGVAVVMVKTASRPSRQKKPPKPALVEVATLRAADARAKITAMGTIVPSQTVKVRPEVQGQIVDMSRALVPGGRVKKGDVLARIDARDYTLAQKAAEAAVEKARFDLKMEQGRRSIAEREWKLVGDPSRTTEEGKSLALREPHLANAVAALESAESSLERAKLSVARTVVRAPFNAMIKDENVDVGQVVGPNADLMTLVGTDAFWVQVSVPVADLPWIGVPGAAARIEQEVGSTSIVREGRVIRLLGDLDPKGRMARLLVEVEDPLGLEREDQSLPLLLGAYVRVEIEGKPLEGVYEVPRLAYREGGTVWLATADDTLAIREVQVAWRSRDAVYVDQGLGDGERLITSRLAAPVNGMKIRTTSDTPPPAPGPRTAERAHDEPAAEGRP